MIDDSVLRPEMRLEKQTRQKQHMVGILNSLEDSNHSIIIVDCETPDPYKLYAVLDDLDQQALLGKVRKTILCDDVHTTTAYLIDICFF